MTSDHESLLRETFAAAESLADPDRAAEIARATATHPRSRPWLGMSLAAASVVVAVGAAFALTGNEGGPGPDIGATSTPTTSETGSELEQQAAQESANRAEARAAVAAVLDALPMPPGAVRHDEAPGPILAQSSVGPATSSNTLQGTAWWTVPGTLGEIEDFLLSHDPPGLSNSGEGAGSSSDQSGVVVKFVDYLATSASAAMQGPDVLVQYTAENGGVVIRADSYASWRPARLASSYVGDQATAVHVQTLQNDQVVRSETVTDPDEVQRLAAAYDALPGVVPSAHSCPMQPNGRIRVRLVFEGAFGKITVQEEGYCDVTLSVRHNGTPLDTLLQGTPEWSQVLSRFR